MVAVLAASLACSAAAAAAAAAAARKGRARVEEEHSTLLDQEQAPECPCPKDLAVDGEDRPESPGSTVASTSDGAVGTSRSDSSVQSAGFERGESESLGDAAALPLHMLSGLWQETVAAFLTSGDIGKLSGACGSLRAELTVEGEEDRRLLVVPTLELRLETAEAELDRVSVRHVRVLRLWERLPFNAVAATAAARQGFRNLNKFTMKGCHLYPADVSNLLAPSLSSTPFIKLLNLEKNKIDDKACVTLCESGLLGKVDTLNLRFNMISDAGAAALASCIGAKTLRWINLKMNRISDEGAKAMAGMLRGNHSMVLLNLRRQTPALTDASALAFARALEHNGALETLRLRRNKITDRGAAALAASTKELLVRRCQQRMPLERAKFELDLEENRLGCPGVMAMLRCASAVPSRAHVELLAYGNQVGREAVRGVVEESGEALDPDSERVWFHSKPESAL